MEGGTAFNVDERTPAPAGDPLGGRYELGDLLGSGGMADVYAARDLVLDRDVAIKVFRPLRDHDDRTRFVGEARTLAALSHPGLVTVYDACFEDQRPFLVMRLVDGGTLRQRIDTGGPLAPGQVAALGARLATALAHVHANGIVHRDVKPSNVLIDSAGDHYLADFGLAWVHGSDRLTRTGELVGTACYLAPEQVTGTAVGPAADVYALGLVLLECLTGRTEYEGSDIEVAVARLTRRPHVPDEYGPAWQRLLSAMTEMHPPNRPDARECARRLRALPRTGRRNMAVTQRIVPVAPARPWRSGKVRAGLGGAGAAGILLTALLLATPAGTEGEPVPGGVPARPAAPPAADTVTPKPTQAGNTHQPATPHTARPHGADHPPAKKGPAKKAPANAAAKAKGGKPGQAAKPQQKGPAKPKPGKAGKPK